jgi:nucleoside-diphosphate kinase
MEKTLIIFKPDCMEKKHVGEVLSRFEQAGFEIAGCKMMQLTPAILSVHYAHLASLPFYPPIEKFMLARPVIAAVLRGENAVAKVRDLLGPTDSTKAPKGTIRGDFGENKTLNILHASDSPENAKIEIARFFKPEEVFA